MGGAIFYVHSTFCVDDDDDELSVFANLAIILQNLATFQTTLAIFFFQKHLATSLAIFLYLF